jgi:chromosome segregation ATPase
MCVISILFFFSFLHNSETKNGLEQMKLLLTLLLGAAVQCPNKQIFIGRITELDITIQHGIVEVIKYVTESQTLVLTPEFLENIQTDRMIDHIKRLAKERDKYHTSWISVLNVENEMITNQTQQQKNVTSNSSVSSTAASTPESQHLAVELADLKSKIRKFRQELEEKSEAYMETKEELDHTRGQYEKLKYESQEWYSEARQAATYRDEVDVLREKAERVERLEIEIQRFREKLSDVEFYKTRVEELREDNRMLMETKEMLEDQLIHARKRGEQVMSLESDILKYKQKLNDLALERDVDKSKMQELIDENTQLQLTTKNLMSSGIENQAKSDIDYEQQIPSGDNSLSEQLTNNATTRALKLELENRRLLTALESLKESNFKENAQKILELEKEKKKIQLKCDQLQDNCDRMSQQNTELESVFKNALVENKKLQDIIDGKQQQIERTTQDKEVEKIKLQDLETQIEALTKEKERIQNLSDSIQKRANDLEKSLQLKTKEFDSLKERTSEFDVFKKELNEIRSKLGVVEKENISLNKEVLRARENLEKKELENDANNEAIEKLEIRIKQLDKELDENQQNLIKIQEIEKRNQELISQNKIDAETIKDLQKQIVKDTIVAEKFQQNLEKIGIDRKDLDKSELSVEFLVDKLVKNPESFKTVREIMLHHNKESTGICVLCHQKEIYTVEKDIQFTRVEELDDGMSKLKESFDHLQIEHKSISDLNMKLQAENARNKVEVSTLSSQISSLNSQQVAMQLANSQLTAEKDCMLKKLDILKTQHDATLQDQVTLQCLHEQLSSDYDALNKEKEILRNTIRDLKVEIRNLNDRINSDEKIIEELRVEIETLRKDSISSKNIKDEHSKLKDDFRNLFSTNERLKREYKNIQDQYKVIRAENSRLKLQTTEQSGEMNSRLDHMSALEIELTKTKQQCEVSDKFYDSNLTLKCLLISLIQMLLQMNQSLDADRRTLMDHVSQLLSQYHELLTHSLEDKQHYHAEEKIFTDKVNDLKRQKEKLEEKIMEHYRKLDSCSPKKKPVVANFVKKVKKAGTDLMNKTKNRRSWIEDPRLTQSQFILGSESGGNESDNSVEEPISTVSDNTNLHRDSPVRHSFQKKTSEQIQNVLKRGGIRASLQAVKKSEEQQANRNSFSG